MLSRINWLDIFLAILLLRICYVSAASGLPQEIFKLLGTLCALYFSLHYYAATADFIAGRLGWDGLSIEALDLSCLVFLAVAVYLLFVLLRLVFCRFIKMEAGEGLNKWGGLAAGLARGFFVVGIAVFAMAISPFSYLQKSVRGSFSGRGIFYIAPNTYNFFWGALGSKFTAKGKPNKEVAAAAKRLNGK